MAKSFVFDGPEQAKFTILLAHGAGAPMDSAAMTIAVEALARSAFRVARFEFDYMAARRTSESRRPPPRAERLQQEYRDAVDALEAMRPPIIGGKSMGGRVASMIADDLYSAGRIAGLLCLGYPFHPIDKPDQLRTAHLERLKTPTLIVQGTRDQFGSREEVATYQLSKSIELFWLEDGDHDLKPRKSVSGLSACEHLETMATAVAAWAARLAG